MRSSIARLKKCNTECIFLIMIFLLVFINNLRSALVIMPRKDELEYIWRAEKLLHGEIDISPQHNYFFSLVLALGFFLFGDRLVVAQIIATLISSLVVIATYFLTKELFIDEPYHREQSLLTALLTSIALMSYSVGVRNDPLFIFFYLIACYYALKSVQNQNYLKFAGVFAGFTYLTRDPGLLIIPVLIVYALLNRVGPKDKQKQTPWKGRLARYKGLGTMILLFLVVISPKLFWKWDLFGSPFYIRNSNFWLDSYEDKYHTRGWLPDSDYQPSLSHYLQHHTFQDIINRLLLGMREMIYKIQLQLTILVFLFALLGLLLFRKKRDMLVHFNLALWFVVFSWLFGIRPTTRWITPMFPFFLISAVGVGFKITYWLTDLTEMFLRGVHLPIFVEDVIQSILKYLTTRFKTIRSLLRARISLHTFIVFITIFFAFSASLSVFIIRSDQIYAQSLERLSKSSEYYKSLMDLVNWATVNTPEDATFMARDGHDLLEYYAHREAIVTPNEDLDSIMKVIHTRGVDYLIIDSGTLSLRPALEPIYRGELLPEGFSLVYKNYEKLSDENPDLKIQVYEIQLV